MTDMVMTVRNNPHYCVVERGGCLLVEEGHGETGRALEPQSRTLKVLVVEDNQVNQMVAAGVLKKLGHRVDVATHGAEALELWRRGGYDLIFMDLQMPVMDGYQAVTAIRQEERQMNNGSHIPIVALTAHALDADRRRCAEVGMDGFITKPINRAEFVQALNLARPDNGEA